MPALAHALRASLAAVLAASPTAVLAQTTSASAAIAALYGTGFDDVVYGLNTSDRRMSSLHLTADGAWPYGENTFFLRVFSGDLVDADGRPTGESQVMYAEWTSRLSIAALLGRRPPSALVRDVFIAGQINRGGSAFKADLVGTGVKLRTGALATTSTLYYRRATGERPGIKFRTSWTLPARVAGVKTSFEGSEEFVTGGAYGTDASGMPALLVDLGPLTGSRLGPIQVGAEWFHHHTREGSVSMPQVMVRWSF